MIASENDGVENDHPGKSQKITGLEMAENDRTGKQGYTIVDNSL